ncbi:hypothetical protein V1264_005353 [Littorina saxatilis]|uniref:Integrase catalytic domain-containing protein n=1 Tax=Littorina saxatilis TaxID=31220 RepID=A0AAN9G6U7_9CAEN
MAEFWAKGVELGLKGKQLTEFVESQTRLLAQREERQAQREREERQAQREREEKQAQREEKERQAQREERQAQREDKERQAQREERDREAQREERQFELKRLELQIKMERKRLELQTEMMRVQNEHEAPRLRDNQQQMLHRASKLPASTDGKDQIDTPDFTGEVEAVCLKKPLYDLLIGNIGGARRPDDPDVEWRMGAAQPAVEEEDSLPFANEDISELLRDDRATVHRRDQPQVVSAVTTRAQAKKDKTTTPLRVTNSSATAVVDRDRLIQLQEADSTLTKYRSRPVKEMTKGEGTVHFEVKAKILYRVFQHPRVNGGKPLRQVLVPQPLRRQVVEVAHDSIMGGHLGVKKTSDRIQAAFYWPGLHADVTRFCRSCDICQKTIPRGRVPKVPLQKMPLIDRPFKRVAIDLIGEIKPPSEAGHRWVLTLVDYATRYPEAVPLKKIDTETVAEALVDIFSRIGVPEEILTDLGTQFVSECMEEVNRLLSIRHLTTTPYHPMCNGLVEKFNATLKSTLKKLCSEQPRQWHRYINALLFAYREVPQESTGFSPFELMYGRTVRGPMQILKELWTKDVDTPEVKNSYQYVFELREKLEETLEIARENLRKSQDSGKHYYDRKAVNRKFTPGNKVLILLPTDHNKLLMQWKGPYEVEAVVGINDYKVNVGKKSKIYHANLLKLYVERPPEAVQVAAMVEEPAELDEFDGEELLELGDLHKKEGVDDVKLGPDLTEDQQKGLLLENVTKILNAPRPETKKQVQSFLGLAGYYREFIPNFAAITAPLSDMTRKGCPNRILWGPAQEKAYQTVRDLMSRDPVLRLPDTAKEFILRTDASDEGIGAMLMQEHGGKPFPVSYASKKLSGAEKNYSTMEKECLAIVWGIKKFELYLQGVKFVLQTDHKPLTYLNSAKFVNNRIMRWVMYLQNFDMRVESIKGSDNVGADFLSRVCD